MILRISDRYTDPDNNYGYGIPNFGSALGIEDFSGFFNFFQYFRIQQKRQFPFYFLKKIILPQLQFILF